MKNSPIGLGSQNSTINPYIANRPPIDDYPRMNKLRSLAMGELAHIVKHTSNHWRKAFSVTPSCCSIGINYTTAMIYQTPISHNPNRN